MTPAVSASEATPNIAIAIAQRSWGCPRRTANCFTSMPANTNATTVASSGKTHMALRIALRSRFPQADSLEDRDRTPTALLDRGVLREAPGRHLPTDRRAGVRGRRG